MIKSIATAGCSIGIVVAASGSASGQDTFTGTDGATGNAFSFFGIQSDINVPFVGGFQNASGFTDANVGGAGDAFDNAAIVTINGEVIDGSSFSTSTASGIARFDAFDSVGPLSIRYRLVFRDDVAVAQLYVFIENTTDMPEVAEVLIEANSGADGEFRIWDTFDIGDGGWTTDDHWIVTEDANASSGDPAVLFVYGEEVGGIRPTTLSTATSYSSSSAGTAATFTLNLDPFEEQALSVFYEIGREATDVDFFGSSQKYTSIEASDLSSLFRGTFGGQWSQLVNYDIYAESSSTGIGDIRSPSFWSDGVVPDDFTPIRIDSVNSAFLDEPGTEIVQYGIELASELEIRPSTQLNSVFGKVEILPSGELVMQSSTYRIGDLMRNDGTVRILGDCDINRFFGPGRIWNAGLLDITGFPFANSVSSLTSDESDSIYNEGTMVMRGGSSALVNFLSNRGQYDVVFANAVLTGNLFNETAGAITVSGDSQFNVVGSINNEGLFVLTSDSGLSVLGSYSGNGIEGAGGPGTAGTVFIRDGVAGRTSGTNRIGFDGPLSLGSSASTTIRLGGTVAGSDFDQIVVADTFNAAGTIRFESVNGFVPQARDVFDVLDFGSVQGAFSSIEFDATLAGLGIDTSDLLVDGTIRIPDDCLADTNGDGVVSPADFNAWIIAFNSQAPACDQNGDGLCTPADFNAWIINYNAGCN